MESFSTPLVSIIVLRPPESTFLSGEEILFRQTYKNVEVVYADTSGFSWQNLNSAIRKSSGNLILISTPEVIHAESLVEKVVHTHTNSSAELFFTKMRFYDSKKNLVPANDLLRKDYDVTLMDLALEPSFGFAAMKFGAFKNLGNLFFTRRIFEKIGGFQGESSDPTLTFILESTFITEPQLIPEELVDIYVPEIARRFEKWNPESKQAILNFLISEVRFEIENKLAPIYDHWPVYFYKFFKENKIVDIAQTYLLKKYGPTPEDTAEKKEKYDTPYRKKRIHLISHDLSLSGAPTLVYELAKELSHHQTNVVLSSPKVGPLLEKIHEERIPFVHIKYGRWALVPNNLQKLVEFLFCYFQILKDFSGKVIVNSIANWPLLLPLYLNPRVNKIYFYIHEDFSPYSYIRNSLARKIIHKILKSQKIAIWYGSKYSQYVWNSLGYKGDVKYFSGFKDARPVSLNNDPPKKIQYLFIGTFCARKGPTYLIAAFERALRTFPTEIQLTVAGFDINNIEEYTMDLLASIDRVNKLYPNAIKVYPQVPPPELDKLYKNSHIYISPSLSECLPIAILNALRHGMPVITTDVGGCSEAVHHRFNGFSIPSRDVKGLADAILYFPKNFPAIASQGKNSSKLFSSSFSNDQTIQAILGSLQAQ